MRVEKEEAEQLAAVTELRAATAATAMENLLLQFRQIEQQVQGPQTASGSSIADLGGVPPPPPAFIENSDEVLLTRQVTSLAAELGIEE